MHVIQKWQQLIILIDQKSDFAIFLDPDLKFPTIPDLKN